MSGLLMIGLKSFLKKVTLFIAIVVAFIGVVFLGLKVSEPEYGNDRNKPATMEELKTMNLDSNKAYFYKRADGSVSYLYGYEVERVKYIK